MSFDDLTFSQRKVMLAFEDIGGWGCWAQLRSRGASAASLPALECYGFLERRELVHKNGWTFTEWRIPPNVGG